jgi:hypothetical protein
MGSPERTEPVPKPGNGGRDLVDAIKRALGAAYELDEREELLLKLAAHQADDLARLEADIRDRGTTVLGSTGQQVLNPAFSEARLARLALEKLLSAISLPDSERDVLERAQEAAAERWRARAP